MLATRRRLTSLVGTSLRFIGSVPVPELHDLKERLPRIDEEALKNHVDDFPHAYPDFARSPVMNRRVALRERLERADMMDRRQQIHIPEFYVGSILAVTSAQKVLGDKLHRFVGICIRRQRQGLHHQFTLRNVVDGVGVEYMYEMYNPTVLKIETLLLEKRLDDDLSYLVDALPEYSTFDFNMEPLAHPPGAPVPVNPLKVKMKPPPWKSRWEIRPCKGIEDAWTNVTPWYRRKLKIVKLNDWHQYDVVAAYREDPSSLEHELAVEREMSRYETARRAQGGTMRRLFAVPPRKGAPTKPSSSPRAAATS